MLDARGVNGKIEGLAGRGRVFAEVPQAEAVIAVDRLDDIGFGVELNPHLAEIITQQHADLAADGGVFKAWQPGLEHRAPFGNKAVVVAI